MKEKLTYQELTELLDEGRRLYAEIENEDVEAAMTCAHMMPALRPGDRTFLALAILARKKGVTHESSSLR